MCLNKKVLEKQSEKARGGAAKNEKRQKSMRQGAERLSCSFLSLFLSFSPSCSQSSFWASGPFTSCLICIMNDSEKANKVIGLWDVRLWPHVEKGPTAVSTGRGTVALYSILSEGYRAFFQGAHDLLRSWKKRGRSAKGDWRRGMGVGMLFRFFSSQVNPHYPGLQSLAKDCAQT